MKFDQLPVEMLMKVFSYLPKFGELSQVNKRFYGIACKVNDSNISLRINRQFVQYFFGHNVRDGIIQSIPTSDRRITKVEIVGSGGAPFSSEDLRFINFVAFSATIKVLKLVYVTTDKSNLIQILSMTPNVEYLQLSALRHLTEKDSPKKLRSCNQKRILNKLKTLLISYGCDLEFVDIFNCVPAGVITELEMHCNVSELINMLNRQLNIRKLAWAAVGDNDLTLDNSAMEVFEKLKLDSFEILHYHYESTFTLVEILSKLTTIKSLDLAMIVDDDVMDTIARHSELETLSIDATGISVASFENIRKLERLRDVKMACSGNETTAKLRTLAESKNTSIKRLSLKMRSVSGDHLKTLAKSAPNLTHLSVDGHLNSTRLNAIMRHFNFVETLAIPTCHDRFTVPGNYFNPKLRHLEISDGVFQQFQKQQKFQTTFAAAYPNLTKLKIRLGSRAQIEIRPILNAFTKLESLALHSLDLVVKDLNLLTDRKDNLKVVSLGNLRRAHADELVKELKANFNVVRAEYVHWDCFKLCMAVDRYSMCSML